MWKWPRCRLADKSIIDFLKTGQAWCLRSSLNKSLLLFASYRRKAVSRTGVCHTPLQKLLDLSKAVSRGLSLPQGDAFVAEHIAGRQRCGAGEIVSWPMRATCGQMPCFLGSLLSEFDDLEADCIGRDFVKLLRAGMYGVRAMSERTAEHP